MMKQVFLVAKETYIHQVKSWGFLFLVLAPFITILVSMGGGYLAANFDSNSNAVAIVNPTASLEKLDFLKSYPDETAAKAAVEKEKVEGYLVIAEAKGSLTATYHGEESLSLGKKDQVQTALNQAQEDLNYQNARLNTDQTSILNRQASYQEALPEGQDMKLGAKMMAIFGIVFVVYMMAATYSASTAQEIAAEKGTKILEIIFSSVPADLYFYGRILGMFLALFTHLGIYAVGGSLAYLFLLSQPFANSVLPFIHALLAQLHWFLLPYLLLGMTFYVILAALCGALVVRQEDVSKALQPVSVMIMVGFFLSLALGQGGQDSPVLQIFSYVPGMSVFAMPLRMINGNASILEALLSFLVLLAATVGLTFFIGKSYAGIALQTDDLGLWKSLKKGLAAK